MLNAAWIVAAALTLQAAPVPSPPAPADWTDDKPITRIVQNLGHDLATLPRPETAALAGAGLLGVVVSHRSDHRLSDWARDAGRSSYSGFGRILGDGWTQAGGAVGAYAIGKLTHRPVVTHIGSDLVRAQVLNGVLTTGLKVAVGRRRPTGSAHAFPSGHTSATFATAAVIQRHYGWKVAAPCYALGGYVSVSRLVDHEHFLSDVIFGAAVGIVSGRAASFGHGLARVSVGPTLLPRGIAITGSLGN